MEFKDELGSYMNALGCSVKELAGVSGLSAATVSRYRTGERTPKPESSHFAALLDGLSHIAREKGVDPAAAEAARERLRLSLGTAYEGEGLRQRLNLLIDALGFNASKLSRALNYDASYLSRVRRGQRRPARPVEFASGVASYVARTCTSAADKEAVARLVGCSPAELEAPERYRDIVVAWLLSSEEIRDSSLEHFMQELDAFDLNEYIRAIHFDELRIPSSPLRLPISRSYHGLDEMMKAELEFCRTTVLSGSNEPVTMYSNMPMARMARDPEFPKKWMLGMALMLKKGLRFNQIHYIDRSFDEMMLGLESWIPLYMTGQVSPYYLPEEPGSAFLHLLKVSGAAALSGEAIAGYHEEGRYLLTNNKAELAYYQRLASRLLGHARPLMEIFRSDVTPSFQAFLDAASREGGGVHACLSAPPLHTIPRDVLEAMLSRLGLPEVERESIRVQVGAQQVLIGRLLENGMVSVEVPLFDQAEFEHFTPGLSLSDIFFDKALPYTWDEWLAHMEATRAFAAGCPEYELVESPSPEFRNVRIVIREGRWVLISKSNAPAIHFLVRHPKMRAAFEGMYAPVRE